MQKVRNLSLIRVDRSDSGVYVCSVSGTARTMNISLLVEHSPIITPTKVVMTQSPGYSSSLSCEVAGVPVPSVSWYRLRSPMGPSMMKSQDDLSLVIHDYKDGKMISSLVFHNITQDRFGQYSCNATNYLGQVQTHTPQIYIIDFSFQASSIVELQFSPTPVIDNSATTLLSQGWSWLMSGMVLVLLVMRWV